MRRCYFYFPCGENGRDGDFDRGERRMGWAIERPTRTWRISFGSDVGVSEIDVEQNPICHYFFMFIKIFSQNSGCAA